jgi:hypothetical protein
VLDFTRNLAYHALRVRGGIEGGSPQGELKSQQAPAHEGRRSNVQQSRHTLEGGSTKSQERQPLPDVLDVLERKAQLTESGLRHRPSLYKEYYGKLEELGDELATIDAEGTPRDRLILAVYKTFHSSPTVPFHWSDQDLDPEGTRKLMAQVAPMSEDELREKLHKAQETLARRTAAVRKAQRTKERSKEVMKREEKAFKRRLNKMIKEQTRLQAEQQPIQVFPTPTKE